MSNFFMEVKTYSFPYTSVTICLHLMSVTFKILVIKHISLVTPKATELRELFLVWRRKTSMKLEDSLYYKFCENYDLQQTK